MDHVHPLINDVALQSRTLRIEPHWTRIKLEPVHRRLLRSRLCNLYLSIYGIFIEWILLQSSAGYTIRIGGVLDIGMETGGKGEARGARDGRLDGVATHVARIALLFDLLAIASSRAHPSRMHPPLLINHPPPRPPHPPLAHSCNY
jgi:hypothetical protein